MINIHQRCRDFPVTLDQIEDLDAVVVGVTEKDLRGFLHLRESRPKDVVHLIPLTPDATPDLDELALDLEDTVQRPRVGRSSNSSCSSSRRSPTCSRIGYKVVQRDIHERVGQVIGTILAHEPFSMPDPVTHRIEHIVVPVLDGQHHVLAQENTQLIVAQTRLHFAKDAGDQEQVLIIFVGLGPLVLIDDVFYLQAVDTECGGEFFHEGTIAKTLHIDPGDPVRIGLDRGGSFGQTVEGSFVEKSGYRKARDPGFERALLYQDVAGRGTGRCVSRATGAVTLLLLGRFMTGRLKIYKYSFLEPRHTLK